MLADSSLNIVPSLLSFNLGVEVGQLLIAFSCWSILYLTQRIRSDLFSMLRVSMAAASGVISVFLVGAAITSGAVSFMILPTFFEIYVCFIA